MATAAEYQTAYAAIYEDNKTMTDATATALAASDTGAGYSTPAFQSWLGQQISSPDALNSSGAVLGMWELITGSVPTQADLKGQVTTMLNIVADMVAKGVPANQAVDIAYKGMGASLANSPFDGTFATHWNQDTNTVGGQQGFVAAAFQAVLGRAPSAAELVNNVNAFEIVKAFYASSPVAETATDARAKGEFIADLLKQAVDFSQTSVANGGAPLQIVANIENALSDLGVGTYVGGTGHTLENQPGTGASQTLTLTPAIDNLTANTANAVFNSFPQFNQFTGGNAQTLNAGDSLTDLAGGGTLNVTMNAAGMVTPVTMSGIATANIQNISGTGAGFSGNISDLHTATLKAGSNGAVQLGGGATFGAIAAGTGLNAALQTVNINANQGFFAGIAAAAVSGTSDAITVNVTGAFGTKAAAKLFTFANDSGKAGTAAAVQNVYESETINATGATFAQISDGNTGVLSTTTLKIGGAGAVQLSAAAGGDFAKLTTIDASGNTGGVTITGAAGAGAGAAGLLTGNTALTSFTGGTGADSLDVSGRTLANIATLTANGGDGNDTIMVTEPVATTTLASTFANVSNFEILGIAFTGAAAVVDFSKLPTSFNELQFESATGGFAVTANNVASTFTMDTKAFASGSAITVGAVGPAAGTSDVFNLILGTSTAGETVGAVTVTGDETVNITSQGGTNTVGAITLNASAGGSETLNIGGTKALTAGLITLNGNGTSIHDTDTGALTFAGTNAALIDASTSGGIIMTATDTGNAGVNGVVIHGSTTKANVINGSLGNDTLSGGNGGDTIITGGGGDQITLGTSAKTDHVGLYVGTGALTGSVIAATAATITDTIDQAVAGFWSVAPGTATGAATAIFTMFPGTGGSATFGTSADMSTVTNFSAGTAATSDVLDISVSAWGTSATHFGIGNADLTQIGAQWSATGTNAVIAHAVNGGTLTSTTADVIILDGTTFANAGAVAQALKSGSYGLTFSAAGTAGDTVHLIVGYNDASGNGHLADVAILEAASASAAAQTNIAASDLVKLTGVSVDSLAANNIHFIT